jgi:hypothetical protein
VARRLFRTGADEKSHNPIQKKLREILPQNGSMKKTLEGMRLPDPAVKRTKFS